jgi:hypothetical protein
MHAAKLSDGVTQELAGLRGRPLGTCRSCGEPVFRAQSFTRFRGYVTHVRCVSAARSEAARPAPRGDSPKR